MADPYIGEIRPFCFDYEPMDWLFCNGQQLNVVQYQALYAVIGNRFGGNTQVFNLPDLRGVTPLGMGAGPGLTPRSIGQKPGTSTVTLTALQMPSHTHTAYAEQESATSPSPGGKIVATVKTGTPNNPKFYKESPQPANLVAMAPSVVAPQGSGLPHENMQPYQVLNYCICYSGIFPVRP